ncbi:MAG: hypothetical protein H6732_19280 [Alphaproteobacteria bacterium]|nr:hypothetical protein [Alphaproteobacteria bacterium]
MSPGSASGAMAQRLAGVLDRRWPPRDARARRLGREGEHPVVHPDGSLADIAVLWPRLAALPGAEVHREGELVVGVDLPGISFAAEVGRGTIELIVGPCDDLHAVAGHYEAGMAHLLAAAEAEGLWVLGHGLQPVALPSLEAMTRKQRYGVLHEELGDVWLWFALTASDQLHVDVAADERVAVANLTNLLAPVTIALCANSAIHGGAPSGTCSTRETAMGTIQADQHRHGMLEGPVADLEGWVGRTLDLPYLMHREAGVCTATGQTFRAWLDHHPRTDDAAFDAWLWHEHYIWNSARLRTVQGTIEVRAACQQPWGEHLAAAVLGTGMVAAHAELATFLDAQLGAEAWPRMRAWHRAVVREGLAATEPVPGLVAGVVERVRDGLIARGRGEAALLAPIEARLAARENPAQRAVRVHAEGGLPAVLDLLRVR